MNWRTFYEKRCGSNVEAEGWLLTYSDMMTLILCFFLIIASVSSVNIAKVASVSEAFEHTIGGKGYTASTVQQTLRTVQHDLSDLITLEGMQEYVTLEPRATAIAIHLKTGAFFESGSAELKSRAQQILSKIIAQLIDFPYQIAVEGHTDSVPIHSVQFPSNWELSGARASRVVRNFLTAGFPKSRLSAVGLADTQPLAPDFTSDGTPIPENQSGNRRVVIVLSYLPPEHSL